ncbi:MAG: preprotein translocase subunit YajC [Sedimentibacter sp.]|uniref:preprotein translocase subunit YajC n=1 Tax=Sedimentibacter sp. TaxID=1960295 RepID=UPI003158D147
MPQEYSGILMMIILFAVMYFMMIRPQKKKDKEIKAMRDSLSNGDEVITIGGIHGKVVKVNDEVVTLEMAHAKQRLEFSKWAIGSVVKKGKDKSEAKQDVEDAIEESKTEDEDK